MQPAGVVAVGVGGVLVEAGGLADRFGQIFREVADVAAGFFGAAQDALDVHLRARSGRRGRVRSGPRTAWSQVGQRRAGVGVGEGLGAGVPDRQPLVGVEELVMGGPPDLVVGRGGDRPQFGAGDGAADGGVEVRGAAFLGFDGAEVLHIPPDTAAGVLPEPIQQRREVDRVAGGPPVVIPVRVDRRPVGVDPAVGVEGEGEEGGGPVASGEHPPYRALVDRSAGQVRGVLAAPGGALDRLGWWIERGEPAAYPGARSSVSSSVTDSAICSQVISSPMAWHWA